MILHPEAPLQDRFVHLSRRNGEMIQFAMNTLVVKDESANTKSSIKQKQMCNNSKLLASASLFFLLSNCCFCTVGIFL